jgi:outer membrane protein OmpA-like peptidoglycan-associated protein
MLKGDLGFTKLSTDYIDIANLYLNLRYKLTGESKNFRPYLFAGPGITGDNKTSGLSFNVGVGAKYYVGPAVAFYLDAGYLNGIKSVSHNQSVHDNFAKATLGLEIDLGKAKDSDNDGVSDKKDKCPDTPPGVKVDEHGCPVDTDGDGVPDYQDDCPTVAGLTSLKGCPDRDGDGVADKDDRCPDVAGLVSLKGCPDSDGDGVADIDDRCPDTPKGWKVDATGCPLDQDKDGVPDAIDKCPTVPGPKENNGCPVEAPAAKKEIMADQIVLQKIKADPVHFVTDKSYLTDYSKGILGKLIQTLNADPELMVNIFGYADSRGSDPYNINLSQERINSVIAWLTSKGIAEKRIIHQKAFGKANPVATNKTAAGRLLNRRVEFELFKMK